MVEAFEGSESIGKVDIITDREDEGIAQTEVLEIWPEYRNRGNALAMYRVLFLALKEKGFKEVWSSNMRLEGGEGVWNALTREFPISQSQGHFKLKIALYKTASSYPAKLTPIEMRRYVTSLHTQGWDKRELRSVDVSAWAPEDELYVLQTISIDDPSIAWGEGKNPGATKEYADRSTPLPPIVVGSDRKVIDGYHRRDAAKLRGDKSIQVYMGVKNKIATHKIAIEGSLLYHGTSIEVAKKIVQEGMPFNAPKRNYWLIPDLTDAQHYGNIAARALGDKQYAVVRVDGLKVGFAPANLKALGQRNAITTQNVPPEAVLGYEVYDIDPEYAFKTSSQHSKVQSPAKLYHTIEPYYRHFIRQHGLDPKNYAKKGVYLATNVREEERAEPQKFDQWEVNVQGLNIEPDEGGFTSTDPDWGTPWFVCHQVIPPQRLKLLPTTFDPHVFLDEDGEETSKDATDKTATHKTPALSDNTYPEGSNGWAIMPEKQQGTQSFPPLELMLNPDGTPKTSKLGPNKKANVQVCLSGPAREAIWAVAKQIPPEHLDTNGVEDDPHVTIKFGVEEDLEKLAWAVGEQHTFPVVLGKMHVFTASKAGGSPVVVEALASDLHVLHELVDSAVGNRKDDFPYKPHVTIAFVKPEFAAQYEGLDWAQGISFSCSSLVLSRASGARNGVPFGSQIVLKAIPEAVDAKQATTPPKDIVPRYRAIPDYGYHASHRRNRASIKAKGLMAQVTEGTGSKDKGVWLERDQESLWFLDKIEHTMDAYRVDLRKFKGKIVHQGGIGEYLMVTCNIPVSAIDIWDPTEQIWFPLQKFEKIDAIFGSKQSARRVLLHYLQQLAPDFAAAAQASYDTWEQDENGVNEELGTGGICDEVSTAIQNIIADKIPIEVYTMEGGQDGDDHSYVIAYMNNEFGKEVYSVDIPPGVYETGGGYSWKKIPGVTIRASDVEIAPLDLDPEELAREGSKTSAFTMKERTNEKWVWHPDKSVFTMPGRTGMHALLVEKTMGKDFSYGKKFDEEVEKGWAAIDSVNKTVEIETKALASSGEWIPDEVVNQYKYRFPGYSILLPQEQGAMGHHAAQVRGKSAQAKFARAIFYDQNENPLTNEQIKIFIEKAYAGIGVIYSSEGIRSEASGWMVGVDDNDPNKFHGFVAYKQTPWGRKIFCIGHDNSREGVKDVLSSMQHMVQGDGAYIEASGRIEQLMESWHLPKIPVETVIKLLPNKTITPVDEFHYSRTLSGGGSRLFTKVMFGHPKIASTDPSKIKIEKTALIMDEDEDENEGLRYISADVEDDEAGELSDQAYELARKTVVNILRDKEPTLYALFDGMVVGALFVSTGQDHFSFDVVVDSEYQGSGIGSRLVAEAENEYQTRRDAFGDDYTMQVDVINPKMKSLLERKGYQVTKDLGGRWMMTKQGSKTAAKQPLTKELLEKVAWEVRDELIPDGESAGYCEEVSEAIVEKLHSMGYTNAFTASGQFLGNVRHPHMWVRVGPWEVDATQDQFAMMQDDPLKEAEYAENPVYIGPPRGAGYAESFYVGKKIGSKTASGIYDEDYIAMSLQSVGPKKPVGYLPLPTISQSGYDPEALEKKFRAEGKGTYVGGYKTVGGGGLWVYDRIALAALLSKHAPVLEKAGWSTDPDEFVYLLTEKQIGEKHQPELYGVIGRAFDDFRYRDTEKVRDIKADPMKAAYPLSKSAKGKKIGQVYLLHFDIDPQTVVNAQREDAQTGIFHARHYLGWAEHAESRIQQHRDGSAARLTQVLKERGLTFTVAKIWDNVPRGFERDLKNQGGLSSSCPICKTQGIDRYSLRKKRIQEKIQQVEAAPETSESGPDTLEQTKTGASLRENEVTSGDLLKQGVTKLYHGTSSKLLETVKIEGLKPNSMGMLYATTSPDIAWREAGYTVNGEGSEPGTGGTRIVVTINLANFDADWYSDPEYIEEGKAVYAYWTDVPVPSSAVGISSTKLAGSRKKAFRIEVPKASRDHFWDEPPEGNHEFWAFRHPVVCLPGEKVVFTFDSMPVAETVVLRTEGPGKTECQQTQKYKDQHKVFWDPKQFRSL